ncbi:MAG TPA: UbiA family prenyltransferase [Candidatus Methanofastidiosa archaeon]|nr:UbiA family prenyltransferase [Candidatus Methanofastidiosa archaeon]
MSLPCTNSKLKAYLDLTRLHFVFIWPVIFLAGLFMAFDNYGSFSWSITIKAILISTLGFEAAFIQNDIVDIEYDRRDVDWDITKYWRPFGTRPLASGEISKRSAEIMYAVLIVIIAALIYTLPGPNRYYIYAVMAYTFFMEYFYQVMKRRQRFPIAQLLGRTDFMLFAVGGYLCYGRPDLTALLYAVFFYTLAEVHLGINDLSDHHNDIERKMNTVTTMYGRDGNWKWIASFVALHLVLGLPHVVNRGGVAYIGYVFALFTLPYICKRLRTDTTPEEAHRVIPVFHATLLVYMLTMIAGAYMGF